MNRRGVTNRAQFRSATAPRCTRPPPPGSIRGVDPVLIDARGRPCPLPILALARAWRGMGEGGRAVVLATDPAFPADVRAWCESTGAELLGIVEDGGSYRAEIGKVLASGRDLPSTRGSI